MNRPGEEVTVTPFVPSIPQPEPSWQRQEVTHPPPSRRCSEAPIHSSSLPFNRTSCPPASPGQPPHVRAGLPSSDQHASHGLRRTPPSSCSQSGAAIWPILLIAPSFTSSWPIPLSPSALSSPRQCCAVCGSARSLDDTSCPSTGRILSVTAYDPTHHSSKGAIPNDHHIHCL